MKKISLLFSSLLLLTTFNSEAKQPPPGTGVADVKANIYLMLDNSGSMGFEVRGRSNDKLSRPRDVAIDLLGNMYVTEYTNHRVKKFDSTGTYSKSFGGSGTSNGKFQNPNFIVTDFNNNVYVSDATQRIQKFNSEGVWQKTFNLSSIARGLTIDSSNNLYVNSDTSIFKYDVNGTQTAVVTGQSSLKGIDWYGGFIYALENGTKSFKKFNASLVLQSTQATPGIPTSYDIKVTSKGIYISTGANTKIHKYALSNMAWIKSWDAYSASDSSKSSFNTYGLGGSATGDIFVASYSKDIVVKFNSEGLSQDRFGEKVRLMPLAMKVIKNIVSDTELTDGANFGLQMWNTRPTQRVNISPAGAGTIQKSLDINNAAYQCHIQNGPCWYSPGGGTDMRRAMQEASDYFKGAKSPIDPAAGCQKNFLIVISDGEWQNESQANAIATDLLASKNIQTIVIGFGSAVGVGSRSHARYVSLAKAGGTFPESPLYSENYQHLSESLARYISSAISSKLTFSAPVIMPNIASGDHIFQSTFTYEQDHQWKGRLAKYALTASGAVGALKWDAGAKLNAKSESSRNIWTVANHFGLSTSINNFSLSNLANLKDALWEGSGESPTDLKATNLINFVRGIDAYDENANNNKTEKRWKLGDVYHSRLVVVGPPKSKTTSAATKSNTEAYYRDQNGYSSFKSGTSCGTNCGARKEVVYAGANDGMLHAFDSETGEEMWAFIPPTMLQSLDKMISFSANKTNSIYGVDGSPIVKDIFYDNRWRTVLLSGMGLGGNGYFALDITNPSIPSFLFAFENQPLNKKIYHWDSSGTRIERGYAISISPEYDYSRLGDSLSTPVIVAMPNGTDTKWVAVFGAGYSATDNTIGSSIFVVDLEDSAKILQRIDLTDTGSDNITNSMPADLVAITPDTTSIAKYRGAMIYGADVEGKLWKLNLTNTGTLYEFTSLFTADATLANDRLEFFQVTPGMGADGNLWAFYGTGNQKDYQRISSDIQNRIFALKDKNFPNYLAVNGQTPNSSSLANAANASCPTGAELGWYDNLGASERITGKLGLYNSKIYATKYVPKQGQLCSPGSASVSEHAMACGSKDREILLGDGIATGVVVYKDKIYVGIGGSGSVDVKDEQGNVVGKRQGNIITIEPPSGGAGGGGVITQESWREIF